MPKTNQREETLTPHTRTLLTYVAPGAASPGITGEGYESCKWHLLTVIEHHMPDSWAEQPNVRNQWCDHLRILLHEVEQDNPDSPGPAAIMHLTNMLTDGLQHGNWPWVRRK